MDAWRVYYEHWAMDANAKKKQEFSLKACQKTIRMLYGFMEGLSGTTEDFETCVEQVIRRLEAMPEFSYTRKNKMNYIRNLAELFFPNFLPKDEMLFKLKMFEIEDDQIQRSASTAWYMLTPLERRMMKNLGFKLDWNKVLELGLTSDDVRRMEALLAFM